MSLRIACCVILDYVITRMCEVYCEYLIVRPGCLGDCRKLGLHIEVMIWCDDRILIVKQIDERSVVRLFKILTGTTIQQRLSGSQRL